MMWYHQLENRLPVVFHLDDPGLPSFLRLSNFSSVPIPSEPTTARVEMYTSKVRSAFTNNVNQSSSSKPVWLRFPLGEIIYENRNISRQFGPNFPSHLATLLAWRGGGPLFRPSQIHTIRDVLTTATATMMIPLVGFQDRKNRAPPLRCTNFHLSLVINSPGK